MTDRPIRRTPWRHLVAACLVVASSARAEDAAAKCIADAADDAPIRAKGVVTDADAESRTIQIQDDSAALTASLAKGQAVPARGRSVEVVGRLQPGRLGLALARVTADLPGDLPRPRSAAVRAAGRGETAGVLVEVSGVVRRSGGGAGRLELVLGDGRERLTALVRTGVPDDFRPESLVGASVRVRGVCRADADGRAGRVVLFAADYSDVARLGDSRFQPPPAGRKPPVGAAAATPLGLRPGTADGRIPLLTAARDVRRLAVEEADAGLPVRLRGVVTFANPDVKDFFVHDGTAGLYVGPLADAVPPAAGQYVEVDGLTSAGDFAPCVATGSATVRVLGRRDQPAPRLLGAGDVATGILDGQVVEGTGVIWRVKPAGDGGLTTACGHGPAGPFLLSLPGRAEGRGERLLDAEVRFRGVYVPRFNDRRQLLPSFAVFLAAPDAIEVVRGPPADPFGRPARSSAAALAFRADGPDWHRVKLAGVATGRVGGRLFARDEAGPFSVELSDDADIPAGSIVEAVGFPTADGVVVGLRSAVVRVLGAGRAPVPAPLEPTAAAARAARGLLATLEATVLDSVQPPGRVVYLVRAGELTAEVVVPGASRLAAGTVVSAAGICLLRSDPETGLADIRILCRDAADLRVVREPSGWTARRWRLLGIGLGATVALAAACLAYFNLRLRRAAAEIAARFRQESALQLRYRDAVENAADVIFRLDPAGRLVEFNRAGETLLGYERSEVIGRPLSDLFADPAAVGGAGPDAREWRLRSRDGRTLVFDVRTRRNDADAGVEGIARDVTERHHAEEQLLRLYQVQRLHLENSPLALVEWTPDGRIFRWSPRAEEMFGWAAEEVVGRPWTELPIVHDDDDERVTAAMAPLVRGEIARNTSFNRNRTKDGRVLACEWYNSALRDGTGRVVSILSLALDATERRRLEAKVQQGKKLEAVARLAGGVAHDFNNLLTVINGSAELLLRDGTLTPDGRDLAVQVRRAGEQAAGLTRQLLAVGRQTLPAAVPLDLGGLLRDHEKRSAGRSGRASNWPCAWSRTAPRAKLDPDLMAQVLSGLAVQARASMPHGGRLALAVRRTADGGVMVEAADSGPGLDDVTTSRLFEPFGRPAADGGGPALGLAAAYGIVTQAGGRIDVESEPGRGTTFRLVFPACPAPACPAPSTEPARGTILLVEDEDQIRRLAGKVLELAGYTVLAADGADEALRLHAAAGGRVDLLLTDVVMAGRNGRELAEELERRQPGVRVLYTSAYTPDEVLRDGILAESVAFLPKPFTPSSLSAKVREALSGQG